jgi:hypothetical protein
MTFWYNYCQMVYFKQFGIFCGRGGTGLIFSGSGGLGLKPSGSGFFGLSKFKIGLKAFKSRALITGLKICKKL